MDVDFAELFGSDSESEAECARVPPIQRHPAIEGLSYVPQGMPTKEIERALQCMEGEEWFDPAIGRNQAMRFGKLPVWLRSFEDFGSRLLPTQLRCRQPVFDQMIANYYEPGEGLRAHVDIPHQFADGITIFSLCGTCIMQFARNEDEKQELIEFFLSPGDVAVDAWHPRTDRRFMDGELNIPHKTDLAYTAQTATPGSQLNSE
ncbi:hypothetical protein HDU85_002166 [Gaertneriomyces sp. JEL0708]|nr:hypothetical protein HDU85_002166 [Gaertneriomyces sp. JEL0708]